MIKRVLHALTALAVISVALVSCRKDDLSAASPDARDGYVALRFSADIPDMREVVTRSVNPDGGGVQDMTLFCFDSYGLFITTVKATIKPTDDLSGVFDAEVPRNTRRIHFLANQIMTDFEEDRYRNKSEAEAMALLEGSSGRMIYWARFACDSSDVDIATQIAADGGTITMIRNHAQVSIGNPDYAEGDATESTNPWIDVTGFAVVNTNAFGTAAPYHPVKGFDFVWPDDDFVTLPMNDAKMSDITDVTTTTRQYIFESENGVDDPVSIIIRGRAANGSDELYYRVMLVDSDGEQILVRRNHHYKLHIAGALSFGQTTFEAALTAAATNNVWISISDEVNEVESNDYILTVEKTSYIFDQEQTGQVQYVRYTLKGKNGTPITESDAASVSWIDNSVARQTLDPTFSVGNGGVGYGVIGVNLLSLGDNEILEGTLLVKKGQLQRKIKVISVKERSFIPSWVGTALYGLLNESDPTTSRPHVTVMFTIPESCPAELFPMKVYISVDELDIRAESGMALSMVRDGDTEWYSSGDIESEPDYKYLYTVEAPGVQRIYFENILSQKDGYTGTLYIEAEHFATMTRTFQFTDATRTITVEGLEKYSVIPDGFSEDETVLYRLVPQKRGARVTFDLQLLEKSTDDVNADGGTPIDAQENVEFLLYSQNLNYLLGSKGEIASYDCNFERYADASDAWWQENNPEGGRMMMFRPKGDYLSNGVFVNPAGTGKYSIYMYTNKAKSDEVIRIASNLRNYLAICKGQEWNGITLPDNADENGYYKGNEYRSVTFELANYNPFRFGARVKYADGEWQGDAEEPVRTGTEDIPETVTPLKWTYRPDQKVDIAFDITSFRGSDGKSVHPFKDETFEVYGSTFDIYIDAPMLKIDESRLADYNLNETKLKPHPTIPGRFVYTASRDRETEREFGADGTEVENKDAAAKSQSGERKILPFTTNKVVSAGDIVISSDEEQVVFYSKTFAVTNDPIAGSLRYKTAEGEQAVPINAFVSFERVRNGSRIGAVSVTADGRYELRLRKEYEFSWYADEVELHYTALDGVVYHAVYANLAALFADPDIVLDAATEGD